MKNNHQVPLQFPQPTKPVHAQDTMPFQSFQTSTRQQDTDFAANHEYYDPQPQQYYYYYYNYSDDDEEKDQDHKFLKKLYAKVEEEIESLKRSIEDGDIQRNQTLVLFKKFGAKLQKKLMRTSDDNGVVIQERGGVDIQVDQKLERFKVRTVNLGSGGGQGGDNADDVPKT